MTANKMEYVKEDTSLYIQNKEYYFNIYLYNRFIYKNFYYIIIIFYFYIIIISFGGKIIFLMSLQNVKMVINFFVQEMILVQKVTEGYFVTSANTKNNIKKVQTIQDVVNVDLYQ